MFSLFRKKKAPQIIPTYKVEDLSFLGADMHSHLVPGIDDGSQNLDDSVHFVEELKALGIKKIITTPHIHGEMYDNDTLKVQKYFQPLKDYMSQHHPDVQIQVSAEYFLDSYFLSDVLPKGLMSFGDNHVLVEVSMAGWNQRFSEILFAIQANGYKPILAHPERYLYETNMQVFEQLKEKGVQLQMNLLSIVGYYGASSKTTAQRMMEMGLYDYCGTDLHHSRHMQKIKSVLTEHQELAWVLSEYGFRNRELFS